ncbi:MAG: hypothetical protein ACO1G9_03460 [Bacteroidota bacterium]
MKLKDRLKDNYLTGVLLAFVVIPVTYFSAEGIRSLYVRYKGDVYLYPPPAVQLISLMVSIILFRIIMVNFEKEKIGKGYFFILAMAVFTYFFFYQKMRNS